jgi:hypothetical protein
MFTDYGLPENRLPEKEEKKEKKRRYKNFALVPYQWCSCCGLKCDFNTPLEECKNSPVCHVCQEIIKKREKKIDLEFPNTMRFK